MLNWMKKPTPTLLSEFTWNMLSERHKEFENTAGSPVSEDLKLLENQYQAESKNRQALERQFEGVKKGLEPEVKKQIERAQASEDPILKGAAHATLVLLVRAKERGLKSTSNNRDSLGKSSEKLICDVLKSWEENAHLNNSLPASDTLATELKGHVETYSNHRSGKFKMFSRANKQMVNEFKFSIPETPNSTLDKGYNSEFKLG